MNSSNPAVTSKARAMYGKRITSSQYDELINCKSVTDIASYLKSSTYYSKALENINESTIHRGELELILNKYVFEFYSEIYHYINPSLENLFHYIVEEFILKEILRMVMLLKSNDPEDYIIYLPGFLISHSKFDLMELAKVRSFEELIKLLKGTQYEYEIKKFLPQDNSSSIDYVSVEHSLYETFFKKLFHMINSSTKGSEKQELSRLIGTRLDLLNIRNVYRAKVIFNTDEENIKQRVLPFYHKFNENLLNELISSPTKEQTDELIKKWLIEGFPFLNEVNLNTESSVAGRIENYTQRIVFNLCKNYLHLSQNISTVFYCFFMVSQIELSNIIYIIEGVRYKIPPDDIKRLLIQ